LAKAEQNEKSFREEIESLKKSLEKTEQETQSLKEETSKVIL